MIACISTTPPAASTPTPGPTETSTVTPAPAPSLTPVPAPSLAPLNLNPQLIVLAENLPEPDDLALAQDGSIYISDVSDGTVRQYTRDGRLLVIVSGLSAPEGIVVLADGSLVIAEQGKNRLVRYDPQTGALMPFLDLPNATDNLGVDGIALDAHAADTLTIIVPDSPNGTLLRVSLDGQVLGQIVAGFARPTGAWVEADGSILVADENGSSIHRIHPDGSVEKVADLSIPDDVIEDEGGNIFVNTLGDDAIHLITAGTKQDIILAGGLIDPQGIIFDLEGNLVVTDPGHHRLIKLVIH